MISRRSFTLGAGLSLLLGSVLNALAEPARAGAPRPLARRLVLFFSPNGTVHRHWRPAGQDSSFSLAPGSILEPLIPHKSNIVVCDGIDFQGFDNHESGMAGMLTGAPGGGIFGGKSVDQHVAGKLVSRARFPSLELGVATSAWGAQTQTRMSYSGPGRFASPEDKPVLAFQRIFGDITAAAQDPLAASRVLARRQSLLSVVKQDLADLGRKLGPSERSKVEEHLASIRGIEQRLTTRVADCKAPSPPLTLDPSNPLNVPGLVSTQIDLMTLALACGITNVASLQVSHTISPLVMGWPGLGLGEGHHELSHKSDSDQAGVMNFVKAERWFAEQFALLLSRLQATPDPAGGTLLDSSLVVWVKELGDSRMHDAKSVPFVLAGKAGGALQTGRYLKFGGVSHRKLLASICLAMGVEAPLAGADAAGLPGLLVA